MTPNGFSGPVGITRGAYGRPGYPHHRYPPRPVYPGVPLGGSVYLPLYPSYSYTDAWYDGPPQGTAEFYGQQYEAYGFDDQPNDPAPRPPPRVVTPNDGLGRTTGAIRQTFGTRLGAADEAETLRRDGDQALADGRFDEARAAYLRVLLLGDSRAAARLDYGLAQLALGDYPDAAAAIRETLTREPQMATSTFDLRRRFGRAEDLERIRTDLKRRCDADAGDSDALLLRGFVEYFGGDAIAGRAAFERAVPLSPANRPLQVFMNEMARVTPAPPAARQVDANDQP